ncbi:unnamed protein product [Brassicogethes aeneus]|uniref:Uncharacterized protein n=1 Tax=Brassicogethes aeneus TaxID=1431903 RepID=A0A9P0B424_BRAAE|nr:unnamed protein product [Brassicogethes aeneus]
MSSKYKGMQALILVKNPLSVFVPCCGHSLNLVGNAANACTSAVQFFDFVQNLYTFFTPFYATNKILQDPKMTLVKSKRDKFDKYEEAAGSTDQYVQSRTRTRNVRLDPVDYMKAQDHNVS